MYKLYWAVPRWMPEQIFLVGPWRVEGRARKPDRVARMLEFIKRLTKFQRRRTLGWGSTGSKSKRMSHSCKAFDFMQTFNLVTTSSLELGFNFMPGNGPLVLSALHPRTSSLLRKSIRGR